MHIHYVFKCRFIFACNMRFRTINFQKNAINFKMKLMFTNYLHELILLHDRMYNIEEKLITLDGRRRRVLTGLWWFFFFACHPQQRPEKQKAWSTLYVILSPNNHKA